MLTLGMKEIYKVGNCRLFYMMKTFPEGHSRTRKTIRVYLLKVGSKKSDLKPVEEDDKYWIKVAFLTGQYFLRLHFNKITQSGIIFIRICGVSGRDLRLWVRCGIR